jgi:desulfoferrodoxin (superoxide reductase-like protein)
MKVLKTGLGFVFLLAVLLLGANTCLADKSGVTISAPEAVAKGTEATIKLSITHSGNSFFHYTDWVYIKANGKEIARWEYSMTNRPEGANFVREVKIPINEVTEIVAEANCNLHGSKGPASWKISPK